MANRIRDDLRERAGAAAWLVVAVGVVAGTVSASADVGVGTAIPDVTFRDLDGRPVRTTSLVGKPAVVAFWATWCSRCVAELDHLKRRWASRHPGDLRIVAVSVDEDREDLDAFLAGRSYPFTLCHDPAQAARARFAPDEDLPLLLVIDREGQVRYVGREFSAADAARLDAVLTAVLAPPPAES
jgi:peroxiredoxin